MGQFVGTELHLKWTEDGIYIQMRGMDQKIPDAPPDDPLYSATSLLFLLALAARIEPRLEVIIHTVSDSLKENVPDWNELKSKLFGKDVYKVGDLPDEIKRMFKL